MENKIFVRINDIPKIRIKINDIPRILVKFGEQGLKGDGTTVHSELSNLDYAHSGHTGFQKELSYKPEYKAYEVQ